MSRQARPFSVKQAGLATLKALGVFALFRFLTRKQLRILCYHGGSIGDETNLNPKLFCSAALLQRRLAWLRQRRFTPLTLDTAVNALGARKGKWLLPVVITVDDGWYSSRDSIFEPIRQAAFEVTLYLASEVAQRQIPVLDVTLEYVLSKARAGSHRLIGVPAIQDGVYDLTKPEVRRQLIEGMLSWLRTHKDERALVHSEIERFAQALGVSALDLNLASRRFSYLNADELRAMQQRGCDIQLHGHAHLYPVNQPDALRLDIEQCRSAIIDMGLPSPRHYCYPSGVADEHAPTVLAALQVKSATTCVPGLISFAAPPPLHLLPRFLDGEDVSQLDFEAEMSGVLQFARWLRSRLSGAT